MSGGAAGSAAHTAQVLPGHRPLMVTRKGVDDAGMRAGRGAGAWLRADPRYHLGGCGDCIYYGNISGKKPPPPFPRYHHRGPIFNRAR